MPESTKSQEKDINEIESFVEKEKILIDWEADSRPFKRFSKEFYINLAAISALIGSILFIIEGLMPAVLIAALYFIFYVFTTIEPEKIKYAITTYGIKYGQHREDWPYLGRYWFTKRFNSDVLVVETADAPWKAELVVDSKKLKDIEDVISKFLYLKDTPPTPIDNATNWIASKLDM